jgi:hypothetical protein
LSLFDDEQRSNKIEYQIADTGDLNEQTIRALFVSSDKDLSECKLVYYAQYRLPSIDSSYNNGWEDVRDTDVFQTNFADGEFTISLT